MSRWLPSGLSALSGQISSFTKEVLAEGVEEIDDHATELRSAKARITELEGACAVHKSEVERLKQHNEELGVSLHSHELQRNTLSNQYRSELELKERDMKALKHQLAELSQHSSDLSTFSTAAHNNPGATSADVHSDEFDDIISSQHEINSLRGDVRKLAAEVQHWRRLASDTHLLETSAAVGGDGQPSALSIPQTQAQIQDLKNQLASTIDRHQHELAALQDAHRQTVSSLKSSYSATIEQLKKQITDKASNSKDAGDLHSVQDQLRDMELVRRKLESDLEHTHAADRKKADIIAKLTEQLESVRSENENLQVQMHRLKEEKQELFGNVHELSDERRQLLSEVHSLRQQCKEYEQESEMMKTALSHLDDSNLQSRSLASTSKSDANESHNASRISSSSLHANIMDVSTDYGELTLQNQQLDEQVRELHGRIEAYELELEQFELIKSDWQTEKETLEQVLLKLRSELREKEEILSIVQAQKELIPHINACSTPKKKKLPHNQKQGLIEAAQGQGVASIACKDESATTEVLSDDEDMDVETQAKRLDHQVELLTSGSAMLEDERDRLRTENAHLLAIVHEHRQEVANLRQQLSDHLSTADDTQREVVKMKSTEIEQLKAEISRKDDCFEELRSEFETQKNKSAVDMELQLQEICIKQLTLTQLTHQLEESKTELNRLELENYNLKSDLQQVRSEWDTEKKKLENSLEDLDNEHHIVVNKLMEKRDQVMTENKDLKHRIGDLEIKLSENKAAKKLADVTEDSSNQREMLEPSGDLSRTVATQAAEVARLSEVARVQALEVSNLRGECEALEADLKSKSEALHKQHHLLETQQHELERQRGKLVQLEHAHNDQINQLVTEIGILRLKDSAAQQSLVEANSTNASMQEIINQLKARQSELENEAVSHVQEDNAGVAEVCRLKEELVNAVASSSDNSRVLLESTDAVRELTALKVDYQSLKQNYEEMESVSKLYEAEVERLTTVEEKLSAEVNKHREEVEKLRQELTAPRVVLDHQNEKDSESVAEIRNLHSLLTDKETLLNDLSLKNKAMEDKVAKLNCEVDSLKELLSDQAASDLRNDSLPVVNGNDASHVSNENMHGTAVSNSSELSRLHSTIAHQKDLIDTLNSKYTSLLGLLDDRSKSLHGNSILVDMHRLESEARELRADRERLVAVLGEKTRESSALRNEVHRLTSAAAATQAALAKTQLEARNLAQGTTNAREVNQDMKNEAVKRLSQMIRDKDVEIEALTMKTATLMQVLQDSAPDGSKVAALFGEADTLRSQLAMYQRDREQLINALTAKHQESVGFYEEAQRLAARVSEMGVELEQRAQANNSLSQQYEEKQRALYSALNELSTLRQRRMELERQLASRSSLADPVRKETGSRVSFSIDSDDDDNEPVASSPHVVTEGLSQEIRQYKDAVAEKELALGERDQRINKLEQAIADRERLMEERQQEFLDSAGKLRHLEEVISVRNSELTALRKQGENLTFDLQGATGERSEAIRERDGLQRKCESLTSEMQLLRCHYNELVTVTSKKDYELESLRAQVASLEKLVESAGRGEQHDGEVKMLLTQLEGLRRQMDTLQHERDVACQDLRQHQTECVELRNKVSHLSEREHRLVKECDRLRGHLVQIEEGYTREALESEDREKQLRNRLAAAEEKVLSSSTTIQNVRLDSAKHIESLQIQLHTLAEQRDNALFQLASAQETITSYASSLSNLQMVLEQFQAERQQQQVFEIERYKRDAQRERDEADKVREEMRQMQIQLDEAANALEAAHRLSEQLDRKEAMISALRDEVQLREAQLMKAEEQVRKLTSSSEAKIDKIIIKNLLMGYFHTPPTKRQEALQVIGQILSYSREEMTEITSLNQSSQGSWIGGLFRKKSTSANPGHSSGISGNPYSSFTELFVNFLERESTPQPSSAAPRLPAERMIQEQQDKQHQRRATPAFNPFSTSVFNPAVPSLLTSSGTGVVPTALPLVGSDDAHHPLMRPISPPHLPVFATVSSEGAHRDAPLTTSGRNSADSSGRNTPQTTSAILRDLLQQR